MVTVLLTSFVVCYFTHLTSRVPSLGALRMDMVLGIAAFAAALLVPGEDKLRWGVPTSRRLALFLAYVVLSLPLVTWPGSVLRLNLTLWIKAAFFFLLVVAAVRTEGRLKWLMAVFLTTQAFRILEPLYLHRTQGYWGSAAYSSVGGEVSTLQRLSGAPHDIVNPNQLAWVVVNTIPFLYFLCWRGGKVGKAVFLATMPPFLYVLFLTGSRSGAISFVVVVLVIAFLGDRRWRNAIAVAAVGVPALLFVLANADSGFRDRYLSLFDSTLAGADTRQGRINGVLRQIGSISHNPLFGNGLGTSYETNANLVAGRPKRTHNLYVEIIQETGFIGFGLFAAYLITMTRQLLAARRKLREAGVSSSDWLLRLMSATLAWISMDLVYSLSCYGVSSWEWYLFGGVASVSLALAAERFPEVAASTIPAVALEPAGGR